MQAVGRIGSYISRSVYTVSAPFHPFGGAVDIIVVEQPDGTYKSSPWYVRFGKFQGVLKAREKVVNISVNGVEADFHMYLDHKGEAFFLREVDGDEGESSCSPSSSGEDTDRLPKNRLPLKSKSCHYDPSWADSIDNEGKTVTRVDSRRSKILGLVFGRGPTKEEGFEGIENASDGVRTDSMERAEIAADLLDLRWSTNLASPRCKNDNTSRLSAVDKLKDDVNKSLQVGGNNHIGTGVVSHEAEGTVVENCVEMEYLTAKYVVETATSVENVREDTVLSNAEVIIVSEASIDKKVNGLLETSLSEENAVDNVQCLYYPREEVCVPASSVQSMTQPVYVVKPESEGEASIAHEPLNAQECVGNGDRFRIFREEKMPVSEGATYVASEIVTLNQSNGFLKDIDSQSIATASTSSFSTCSPAEEHTSFAEDEVNKRGSLIPIYNTLPQCILESQISEEEQLLFGNLDDFGSTDAKHLESSHADHDEKEAASSFSSTVGSGVNVSSNTDCCSAFFLDQSVINDYITDASLQNTRLRPIASEACINKTDNELTRVARSLPTMGPLSNNLEASDLGHSCKSSFGAPSVAQTTNRTVAGNIPPRGVDSLRGSERSWPFFMRSKSMKVSHADMNGSENPNFVDTLNNSSNLEGEKEIAKVKVRKKVRVLAPTSEQLSSLKLKEGKNIVIFTFSTAMLGKQQVDARIFLWRWDSRIVISDVDGTITRSDLLGQVMPLVGMDWSQTGVAHLFSAIKENGYQFIFLSARSISQSFLTRQFLFNIKQDGKALPEGPVVISPDGLFPSLFREVVRRAPHEFKIACLEDIKALFPADMNPFYAGFGNRDTDEFSYLKVGIPRGKIFIINPKGEIAVNRRIDTKSYLSLHALVHGMFPSMSSSSSEQEDYNSWNYWKLPPPNIDS